MRSWSFEPGHTAAVFTARHMMVTDVTGAFKDDLRAVGLADAVYAGECVRRSSSAARRLGAPGP
jgi:hypothetical protein